QRRLSAPSLRFQAPLLAALHRPAAARSAPFKADTISGAVLKGKTVPDFQQYIGVRYSGRKAPGDPIREIKVFAAVEDHEIFRELNQGHPSGRWSRRTPPE